MENEKNIEKTSFNLPSELLLRFRRACLEKDNMPLVKAAVEAIEMWLEGIARGAVNPHEVTSGGTTGSTGSDSRAPEIKKTTVEESSLTKNPNLMVIIPNREKAHEGAIHISGEDAKWVTDFLEVLHSEEFGRAIQSNVSGMKAGIDAVVQLRDRILLLEAKSERPGAGHAAPPPSLEDLARGIKEFGRGPEELRRLQKTIEGLLSKPAKPGKRVRGGEK